jgi:hypothetical protein
VKVRQEDSDEADIRFCYEELTSGQRVNAVAESHRNFDDAGSDDEASLNATRAEAGDVGFFTEG